MADGMQNGTRRKDTFGAARWLKISEFFSYGSNTEYGVVGRFKRYHSEALQKIPAGGVWGGSGKSGIL